MTIDEFEAWREWNRINPITDRGRVFRPAALMASAFGGKFDDALAFLHPKPKPSARPLRPVEVVRVPKE